MGLENDSLEGITALERLKGVFKDSGAEPLAANGRKHAPDLKDRVVVRDGEGAQIAEDLPVFFAPHVQSLAIDAVDVLVGALLLDHEDGRAGGEDAVKLVDSELGECFDEALHGSESGKC